MFEKGDKVTYTGSNPNLISGETYTVELYFLGAVVLEELPSISLLAKDFRHAQSNSLDPFELLAKLLLEKLDEVHEEEQKVDYGEDKIGCSGCTGCDCPDMDVEPDVDYPLLNKYHRRIYPLVINEHHADGCQESEYYVDIYDILSSFPTENAAVDHALKKLLAPGLRGIKARLQDLKEARDSIIRAIEIEEACL